MLLRQDSLLVLLVIRHGRAGAPWNATRPVQTWQRYPRKATGNDYSRTARRNQGVLSRAHCHWSIGEAGSKSMSSLKD